MSAFRCNDRFHGSCCPTIAHRELIHPSDGCRRVPLERVAEAAFDCARRLFGVQFVARPDLTAYHPDLCVYEVRRGERTVAIFLHDHFARS